MRLLLSSLFHESPFEGLQKHANKVNECAQLFKDAALCHIDQRCTEFDDLTDQVARLESEADAIKRNIRNHLPRGILMPVDKFQFFEYLKEQDKVVDAVEESLLWLALRPKGIPNAVTEDFQHLVGSVVPPIEKLPQLVTMAADFFKNRSERQRTKMKSLIHDIHQRETEADFLERELKLRVFSESKDALIVFHLVRLIEIVGSIADHAENASGRMRAMIAR